MEFGYGVILFQFLYDFLYQCNFGSLLNSGMYHLKVEHWRFCFETGCGRVREFWNIGFLGFNLRYFRCFQSDRILNVTCGMRLTMLIVACI